MRIGVIGMGHVGTMTADILAATSTLVTYDRASGDAYPAEDLEQCAFVVVCVNTPSLDDGTVDLTQVEDAFDVLPVSVPVVLRSTVPPGTSAVLSAKYSRVVIFWPEYVGETTFAIPTWPRLSQEEPFQLFGAEQSALTSAWLDHVAVTFGPMVRIHRVAPAAAELAKYMENSWFAVKVTFVNEFRRLAEGLGLEWLSVRESWLLDPRVDRDHSEAFAGRPGYGGRCLPKDVAGILAAARAQGIELPMMASVQLINSGLVGSTDESTLGRQADEDGGPAHIDPSALTP